MPRFHSDDVIDYMVLEAIALKVGEEDKMAAEEARREAAVKEFKDDKSALDAYR